jgi:hypothetical protein
MARENVMQLRYLGVIAQPECLEYGFRIQDKDHNLRLVVLTIESGFFTRNELMFQEAPDLCYQKILGDLEKETAEFPISPCSPVCASDIAVYREGHPTTKPRRLGSRR